MPGKIIWRDLLTNDPAASQLFYGELFGWTFESVGFASNLKDDSTYTLIRHNGKLIGGMIDTLALNGRDDISQWVVLMSVENIDAKARAVTAGGGKIITPPTDLQDRGHLALVRDAEGALLGLLETRDGDPGDSEAAAGDFLWDELWTTDVENASAFYNSLTGLSAGPIDLTPWRGWRVGVPPAQSGRHAESRYHAEPTGRTGPGVGQLPEGRESGRNTARVAELGGRVIVEARPRPLGGEAAFIAGPSGAGIALQTWPLEAKN